MPEISRFFGIIITIYYNDHPPPHFHVRYNQQKAIVSIETVEILEGELTSRLFKLVSELAIMHQTELMEDWEIVARQSTFKENLSIGVNHVERYHCS